jgi:hypothetical protein
MAVWRRERIFDLSGGRCMDGAVPAAVDRAKYSSGSRSSYTTERSWGQFKRTAIFPSGPGHK